MQRGKVQLREITPGKSIDTSILKTGHKDVQSCLLGYTAVLNFFVTSC
jgi:hypothetical protein